MTRAADHAEEAHKSWSELAYEFLVDFARNHAEFISEDVSGATKGTDFPQPPTDRAWGAVYRRALKDDVIMQVGSGRSRRRHASICPRWSSLICKGKNDAS